MRKGRGEGQLSIFSLRSQNPPSLARFLIFLTGTLFLFGWAGWAGFEQAGVWLSKSDVPNKAEVIVCLNGTERVKKAAELYHQGLAPRVILTAGKDKKDLVRMGIPENRITLAEWPLTTFQEALAVAAIDHRSPIRSAIVVSDPFHLKRVRWTFDQVFRDSPIQLSFVASDLSWDGQGWWRDKQSRLLVAMEISKMGYYRLVHGLLGLADDPPWTKPLKQRYENFLIKCLS